MANVLAELFQNTANAIREKTGDTGTMKPAEFPEKIRAIETGGGGGGVANIIPLTITENGKYNVADGVDGYAPVTVNGENMNRLRLQCRQIRLTGIYPTGSYRLRMWHTRS